MELAAKVARMSLSMVAKYRESDLLLHDWAELRMTHQDT
jgi:hypothetical protein